MDMLTEYRTSRDELQESARPLGGPVRVRVSGVADGLRSSPGIAHSAGSAVHLQSRNALGAANDVVDLVVLPASVS